MENILNQLKIGIIKGWKRPTLLDQLIKILDKSFIRIFRFIGGLSILILLGRSYFEAPIWLNFITLIIGFIGFLIFILLIIELNI
jgi:hypothetical protein